MLVIGFGSSMPEMVISGFSAAGGNPGLALGNAMGSNIANIALILGATALISLITVRSRVRYKFLTSCCVNVLPPCANRPANTLFTSARIMPVIEIPAWS